MRLNRMAALGLASVVVCAAPPDEPAASRLGAGEPAYRANNVGVALLEQFRYEDAVASFKQALSLQPSLVVARANLAIALFNAQRMDEARAEAMAAARLLPGLGQAHYTLGLAARSAGATEEARAAFQRVVEIDPGDVGARVNLGQILMQERRYGEAAEEFKAALGAEPYSSTAAYNLGLALARAGRAEESQAAMERFRQLREGGYGTTLGQSYPDQGRYAEAIASTGAEPELVDRSTPPAAFGDVTAQRIARASPQAARAGAGPAAGGVLLTDLDADGRLDLFVTGPEGSRLYLNRPAGFEDATARWGISADVPGLAAVAGDWDNDEKTDLLVLRAGGPALLHNDGGRLSDRTAASRLGGGGAATGAFVDADHDGDLDVALGRDAAVGLFQNDGTGRFKDVSAAAGLAGHGGAAAMVPTDFDNRRDVDLLFVRPGAAPALYQNRRDGSFRDVTAQVGLPGAAAFRCVAAGDANKDGVVDFFLGVEDGPDLLALSDGKGRFTVRPAPGASSGSLRALFLDYDNDGLLDLLAFSRRGPRLLRNLGTDWVEVTAAAFGPKSGAWPQSEDALAPALAAGDLDGDGDTDLVVRLPSGQLRVLDNEGGRNHALPVRLAGLVSNRTGTGAKVELRAGSLHQKLETYAVTPAAAPADVVFGLGPRASADAVRVLWPSGVLQTELMTGPSSSASPPAVSAVLIKELDRKPSSCPFLYAWNGRRFEFVTDFMGAGEMGYWQGPGRYNHPDPDEYIRIRADQLQAKEGRYELRVTNELEEAVFLDRLSLLVVAHPDDVEVFPHEGMRSTPPPFHLLAVRDLSAPEAAVDDEGRDLLPALRAEDREFADGFPLHRIRGYAETHGLVLDLGHRAGEDAVLLLTGWTDYAFSSDNVAAHQAGIALAPPRLEVEEGSGRWRAAVAEIGIPVGRPQTVAVPMAGLWRGPSRRVRIVTNMRIYWDQARVGRSAPEARLDPARLDPLRGDLRERGFSAAVSPDGRGPFTYDYDRVSRASPWKAMPGRYTRTGDVRELLTAADDMFVISPPGDEVAVSFDAVGPKALPPGWRRTFLLHADGYSKEMDIHSASPDVLEPLPYHGMPGYPYAPPAAYPLTPARAAYLERYNTRVVRVPMARLDAALFAGTAP